VLLCFIKPILGNRYGPGVPSCQETSDPNLEVAGSSPPNLTTSLAIPIPSSSSSNGPSNNAVDNQGQALAAPCLGRSKVRSASYVRALSNEKISESWVLQSPGTCEILHLPQPSKSNQHLFFFKKKQEKENPKERDPPQRSHGHNDSFSHSRAT